jgi:hypothetical protein
MWLYQGNAYAHFRHFDLYRLQGRQIALPVSSAHPVLDVLVPGLALQGRARADPVLLLVRLLCRDRAGRGLDHILGALAMLSL